GVRLLEQRAVAAQVVGVHAHDYGVVGRALGGPRDAGGTNRDRAGERGAGRPERDVLELRTTLLSKDERDQYYEDRDHGHHGPDHDVPLAAVLALLLRAQAFGGGARLLAARGLGGTGLRGHLWVLSGSAEAVEL